MLVEAAEFLNPLFVDEREMEHNVMARHSSSHGFLYSDEAQYHHNDDNAETRRPLPKKHSGSQTQTRRLPRR